MRKVTTWGKWTKHRIRYKIRLFYTVLFSSFYTLFFSHLMLNLDIHCVLYFNLSVSTEERERERERLMFIRDRQRERETEREREQMIKQFLFTVFTRLLCSHLAGMISHCKSFGNLLTHYNKTHMFKLSCKPVTLDLIKLKRNRSKSIRIHATVKVYFIKSPKLGSIPRMYTYVVRKKYI